MSWRKRASPLINCRHVCVNSQHNPFSVFAVSYRLRRFRNSSSPLLLVPLFRNRQRAGHDGSQPFFLSVPKGNLLMPPKATSRMTSFRYRWRVPSTRVRTSACRKTRRRFQTGHQTDPDELFDAAPRRITALWWYSCTRSISKPLERTSSHYRWRSG